MKPHYTQDEANEILRRAVERLPLRDEMSREQLETVAAELGVTPDALRQAEQDWNAERSDKEERLAYASTKRLAFYKHLTAYVSIVLMVGLVSTADRDPDGVIPAVALALMWGIGIVCHALSAFNTSSAHFDSGYTQWRIERRARELAAREIGRIPPRQDT